MRKIFLIVTLVATPAMAQQQQQQPRPMSATELNGALSAALEQGDRIRQMHIMSEAKASALAAELAQAQARVKELEAKAGERKDADQPAGK